MNEGALKAESFAEIVDDALMHLGACDRREAKGMPNFGREQVFICWPGSPSEWSVTVGGMHPGLVSRILRASQLFGYEDSVRYLMPFGAEKTESLTLAQAHARASVDDDDDSANMSPYQVTDVRMLDRKERAWRQHGNGHRFVAEMTYAAMRVDGRYLSANSYAWWSGRRWEQVETDRRDLDVGLHADFAFAYAAARLGWWTARFHLDGASIDLPTDPSGARAVFADRDARTPGGRRDALRHWVRAHARTRTRADAVDDAWVRAHLRGKTRFSWHGTMVDIVPSVNDQAASTAGLSPAEFRALVAEAVAS